MASYSYPPSGGGSGGGGESDFARAGTVALTSSVQTASVTFSSTLGTANYVVSCSIKNITDTADTMLFLTYVITAQSATGFSILLNAPPDNSNYSLEYFAGLNV